MPTSSGTSRPLVGSPTSTTFAPGKDILRARCSGSSTSRAAPTATLLRSSYVRARNPFWQDGFRSEDEEAVFWMLSRHDFAFVHQVLTFCRQHAGSRWDWSDNVNSHGPERHRLSPPLRPTRARRDRVRRPPPGAAPALRVVALTAVPTHLEAQRSQFFELHRSKRTQILEEAKGDRRVTAAMSVVGALLAREAVVGRRNGTQGAGA